MKKRKKWRHPWGKHSPSKLGSVDGGQEHSPSRDQLLGARRARWLSSGPELPTMGPFSRKCVSFHTGMWRRGRQTAHTCHPISSVRNKWPCVHPLGQWGSRASPSTRGSTGPHLGDVCTAALSICSRGSLGWRLCG